MALDPFRREIPPEHGVAPDWRGMIEGFSASLGAIIPVANATDRAQLVSAIQSAGHTIDASRPLYVHRQDATPGLEVEYTLNGSSWSALGAPERTIAATSLTAASANIGSTELGVFSIGTATPVRGGVRGIFSGVINATAAGLLFRVRIMAGSTVMGAGQYYTPAPGGPGQATLTFETPRVEVSGSTAFSVRAQVINGTGTCNFVAGTCARVIDTIL